MTGSWKNYLKGFCMGCADVVPGVSGGTMALILGIYERLLRAIRSFDLAWLGKVLKLRLRPAFAGNDWALLIPLGLGILSALVVFTRLIPLPHYVLEYPEIIYGLFFGLILASAVVLLQEVEGYGLKDAVFTLLGVAIGYLVVNMVPVDTPEAGWFVFICGFVAISAMLLPGISGSFILLILGKYAYILNAFATMNLSVLLTFMAGALVGLLSFSRAITWLLAHYRRNTMLVIKGILIGSLWVIWPFRESEYVMVNGKQKLLSTTPVWPAAWDETVLASSVLMVLGFVAVLLLNRFSKA